MRIVYHVNHWPPGSAPSGVVSAAATLAPAIRAAGHEAMILALVEPPVAANDAVYVRGREWRKRRLIVRIRDRLAPPLQVFESSPAAIAAKINATPALAGADVVEMEESFGWSLKVARRVAPLVAVRLHGPYFLTGAAAGDLEEPFNRERVRREGRAIAAAHSLTSPSRFVLDAVRARYEVALPDAAVIPNPTPIPDQDEAWRAQAADPDEILFVGRFDRIKGADVLLKAFARLAQAKPRLRLTFAGSCDGAIAHEGRMLDAKALLAALMPQEAAARVVFAGILGRADLAKLRRRAFVTVVCSRTESFSLALAEAMAAGSPVVATRAGAMPELAQEEREALFVAPEDAAELADATLRLLSAPERAAEMGRAARRRATVAFAPAAVASAFISFYEASRASAPGGTGSTAGRR